MPILVSSLRRPPTPASFASMGSGNAARELLQRQSFTSDLSTGDFSPIHSDRADDGMSPPDLDSLAEDDEYEAPPSSQPRPLDRDFTDIYATRGDFRSRECYMEQYVCFVYRGDAIWLRVTVVMEETGRGFTTPHVMVRFMTRLDEDDPALRRIGLIIEEELQEGMRREILAAVRQAVRVRLGGH